MSSCISPKVPSSPSVSLEVNLQHPQLLGFHPPSTEQASAQRNLCEMFTDLSEKSNYQDDFQEFMNTKMKKKNLGTNMFPSI